MRGNGKLPDATEWKKDSLCESPLPFIRPSCYFAIEPILHLFPPLSRQFSILSFRYRAIFECLCRHEMTEAGLGLQVA